MGRADDRLKSLLNSATLTPPSGEFTSEVMKEIEARAHSEVFATEDMKGLLRDHALVAPPSDFTFKVLNRSRAAKSRVEQPVITPKAWAVLGCSVLLILLLALRGGEGMPQKEPHYFVFIGARLTAVFASYQEIISFAGMLVLSVILLLTLDYLLRKKAAGQITK
jgi:hypothetical protein